MTQSEITSSSDAASSFYESAYTIDSDNDEDDDDHSNNNDNTSSPPSSPSRKSRKTAERTNSIGSSSSSNNASNGTNTTTTTATNELEDEEDMVETVAMDLNVGMTSRNICFPYCRRAKSFCLATVFVCCARRYQDSILDDNSGDNDQRQSQRQHQRKQRTSSKENKEKPTNEKLLSVAFISFFTFTCLQALAAYLAQSEAMMGDSVAMAVDAFTYLFNLFAERIKNRDNDDDDDEDDYNDIGEELEGGNVEYAKSQEQQQRIITKRLKLRSKRKRKLLLEIVPPLISVTTLIVVTAFILKEAVETLSLGALVLDEEEEEMEAEERGYTLEEQEEIDRHHNPNLIIMLVFSSLNLLVDVVNMFFFAKADHLTGYNTMDEDHFELGVLGRGRGDSDSKSFEMNDHEDGQGQGLGAGIGGSGSNDSPMGRVKTNFARMRKETRRRKGGAYSHVANGDFQYEDEHEDEDEIEHELVLIASNSDDEVLQIEGLDMEQKLKTISQGAEKGTHSELRSDAYTIEEEEGDFVDNEEGFVQNPHSFSMEDGDHIDSNEVTNSDANLNMCSAYTHVFADTIRSVAVLVAAILAEVLDSITSEVADAAAAVVVSGIILLALVPLFVGLKKSVQELNAIRREEIDEKMIKHRLDEQE